MGFFSRITSIFKPRSSGISGSVKEKTIPLGTHDTVTVEVKKDTVTIRHEQGYSKEEIAQAMAELDRSRAKMKKAGQEVIEASEKLTQQANRTFVGNVSLGDLMRHTPANGTPIAPQEPKAKPA